MIRGVVKGCAAKYTAWLARSPYTANMVSTGTLMATGDVLAQNIPGEDKAPFSLLRTARMAFLGIAFVTPSVLTFYRVMESRLGPSKAMLKVLIDQAVFAPTMLLVFMPSLDLLSGSDLDYVGRHLKDDYWSVLKANWTFWPAVQIFNFSLVPLHLRVIVVQTVALMWNTYLAWKLHSHHLKSTPAV